MLKKFSDDTQVSQCKILCDVYINTSVFVNTVRCESDTHSNSPKSLVVRNPFLELPMLLS